MISLINNLAREYSDFERLFLSENKEQRRLVFYAESSIYYLYFRDYIEYILSNSELDITYLTSDPADKIFDTPSERIHPYYIKNLLSLTFSRLDAKVLVMTTPDLNAGIIKRAPESVHHIYAFHGISSTHQYYRIHAFDHYDSILCIGSYQIEEIRRTEKLYKLRSKELILTGYPLVEHLYRDYKEYKEKFPSVNKNRPLCLIAPTWSWLSSLSTIMDDCIDEIIRVLEGTRYQVWIRPHPEYIKRFAKRIKAIERTISKTDNIKLLTDLSTMDCMYEADVLITDHSTISLDYVLATERPVLFVDTPLPVGNPESRLIDLQPIENTFRPKIGFELAPENVRNMPNMLDFLLAQQNEFCKTVPSLRTELVANWQRAAKVGGNFILSKCK